MNFVDQHHVGGYLGIGRRLRVLDDEAVRIAEIDRLAISHGRRGTLTDLNGHAKAASMPAAIFTVDDLAHDLGPIARLMGIDLGTKTIGLALSDVEHRIATPLETIRRTKFTADARRLIDLLQKFDVAAMVIGLPLNMDGSEGPRAQSTRAFARALGPLTSQPVVFWDERLSTAAVTRELIGQNASRARRAQVVDRMAAAYILQGALDRLAVLARSEKLDEADR